MAQWRVSRFWDWLNPRGVSVMDKERQCEFICQETRIMKNWPHGAAFLHDADAHRLN
jgi:hypothetical protein